MDINERMQAALQEAKRFQAKMDNARKRKDWGSYRQARQSRNAAHGRAANYLGVQFTLGS